MVATVKNSLPRQGDSDKTLASTKIWSPPVPYFIPRITKPRSTLQIACVVSNKLYQGIRFEGNCLLLTPQNWKRILRYSKPDLLLMESCWDTVTGDWYLAQSHPGEQQEILKDILACARQQDIPSVFWNTQDYLYHELFADFAQNFDFVFCADPREADALSRESLRSEVLLPAIQPALHNPFRDFQFAEDFVLHVLYDGWADIIRTGKNLNFLEQLKEHGLSIIESRFRLFRNKLADCKSLAGSILGCVHWRDRLMALKYARLGLMADATISTATAQQWMALEYVACRVPLLHRGELPADDIRRDVVTALSRDEEVVESAVYLLESELSSQKMAHLGWRFVHQNHTFSRRLHTICSRIGISHALEAPPLVSVVVATFRESLLPRCLENFRKQTYPNKELILVVNSNSFSRVQADDLVQGNARIRLYIVPNERVEGGCLNFGIMAAKGQSIVKMDDDDYYSADYVADMMLHQQSVGADVFGKVNRYIHFMDDDTTYSRNSRQLTIIPSDMLLKAHISGNSLSGKTEFLQNTRYSDVNFASTDTTFHGNNEGTAGIYALYDDMGLIMERSADVANHSWTMSSADLKKTMKFLGDGVADDILV